MKFGVTVYLLIVMDYFDTINSTKEAELAYANWYSQLPDARKAKMLCDLFQFGIDTVRYNARKENPFISEAETLMKYIELNLKKDFSPDVYAFIETKMAERAENEWKQRFKTMKNTLGWSYEKMALFMDAGSADALKSSISRKIPNFAKLAICIFEQQHKGF